MSSPVRASSPDRSSPVRASSPLKSSQGLRSSSPVRSSPVREPVRYHSPVRCSPVRCGPGRCSLYCCSSIRCSLLNCSLVCCNPGRCDPCCYVCPVYCSPTRCSPVRCSPVRCSPVKRPILHLHEEDALVNGLRDIISLERELESSKVALTLKPDFNLHDAFRIFDQNHDGRISVAEIRDGLAAIGVFPTSEEVDLFFKRYDVSSDGRLDFNEFSAAFLG